MSTHATIGRTQTLVRLALILPVTLLISACETSDEAPEDDDAETMERVDRRTAEEAEAFEDDAVPARTEDEGETVLVEAGTVMTVRLDETVSTESHDAGDSFNASVTQLVRGADGDVVIPEGASVSGSVEESRRSSGPEEQAILALRLESIEVEGESHPFDATIQNARPEHTEGDSGAETAAKIAIGTAAGALIGQVIGQDTESTVGGAAAGAVAGTIVALTSREGDATLNEGSTFRVQLNEDITGS